MTGAPSEINRDAVTGLLDRSVLNVALPRAVEQATRANQPLSLVMVDLDRFKSVNDTYGHLVGDRVLAGVAARIDAVAVGKGDVYRYGGDELLLILPNHTIAEAIAAAERARRELESTPFEDLTVTASFGVSTFPAHGMTDAELLKAADDALYDAKNRGRNLVRVFGEPEPPQPVREPERKLPVPGALTEHQRKELRTQHYQGYQIRCPKDGGILRVEENEEFAVWPRTLFIRCELCRLSEEI
jgi:diguanylate cyclase (GGDEF)-like protein